MPIGRLVLRDACRQLAEWRRAFGPAAPDAVSVNVSSLQFLDAGLGATIEEVLAATGLDAASLRLEVTESAFIGDVDAARGTVERLQRLGVQWSLDDFGTGYSSLSTLQRLQLDTIKVDRSFVARIGDGDEGHEMVRAIVALGHNLRMTVVAEGVETETQLAALRALGCEFCQGYLFSRPVDAGAAARLIVSQPIFAACV
jgi:EAL domain-containing protein (putative c-di-GMP-specific phosphodiesterase class I)